MAKFKKGDRVRIRPHSGEKTAYRATGVIDHGSHGWWYVKLDPDAIKRFGMPPDFGLCWLRSSRLEKVEPHGGWPRNYESNFHFLDWWTYAVRGDKSATPAPHHPACFGNYDEDRKQCDPKKCDSSPACQLHGLKPRYILSSRFFETKEDALEATKDFPKCREAVVVRCQRVCGICGRPVLNGQAYFEDDDLFAHDYCMEREHERTANGR